MREEGFITFLETLIGVACFCAVALGLLVPVLQKLETILSPRCKTTARYVGALLFVMLCLGVLVGIPALGLVFVVETWWTHGFLAFLGNFVGVVYFCAFALRLLVPVLDKVGGALDPPKLMDLLPQTLRNKLKSREEQVRAQQQAQWREEERRRQEERATQETRQAEEAIRKREAEQREHERRLRTIELSGIDRMSGAEFEAYLIHVLQHRGYQVRHTGRAGDGGVDLVAEKDGKRYAIQAKRQQGLVSGSAISAPVAGKVLYNCTEVMVITNNTFILGAQQLAKANGCILIDRKILVEWILDFQQRTQQT